MSLSLLRAEKLGLGRLPAWYPDDGLRTKLPPFGHAPHTHTHHGSMPLSSLSTLANLWASLEVLKTVGALAGEGHPCDPPTQVPIDNVGNII